MTNETKNSERPYESPVQQQPAGYFSPMPTQNLEEDEIDLFELWQIIWDQRWVIIGITSLFAVASIIVSLMLPNIYRAEVLLAPVSVDSKGGSMAATLSNLGGLASLAGISMGTSSSIEESLAVLKSKTFLWQFVEDNKLMPILFHEQWDAEQGKWIEPDVDPPPTLWDAYRLLTDGILTVSADKKTGLVTLAVEWTDPTVAAQWANELVARLNSYLRNLAIARSEDNLKYLNDELKRNTVADFRQTLYELIAKEQQTAMLANTRREYAVRTIDAAIEPDKKSKPKRALIVILATLLGAMLSVVWIFVRQVMARQRERHADFVESRNH